VAWAISWPSSCCPPARECWTCSPKLGARVRLLATGNVNSEGRAYYDKKLAEGKTHREALRALKRQVSDAIFTRLRIDARMQVRDPGGQ